MILPEGTIKRIHVNQHKIKHNQSVGVAEREVFTIKNRGRTYMGWEVKVLGDSTVVYSPNKPLSCGARVWIETTAAVHVKELPIDYDYSNLEGRADMDKMRGVE